MVHILAQYTNGNEAITHALSLVVGYMLLSKDDKKLIASNYVPNALGRGGAARKHRDAIVVFDIDDTLLFDVTSSKKKLSVIPHQIVVDLLN